MKQPTQIINYRWTALDATAAHLSQLFDIYATPYRIHPRALDKGRRGLELGVPGLDSGGWAFDLDGGFDIGELVSFSLGLSADPPSVARFFRAGYEWIDVPEEVKTADQSLQGVMEACFDLDPRRFAHFDPKVVYTSYSLSAAANWPETMPSSPLKLPSLAMNPYNYPWGDLAMLHFDYWENTDLRAALINQHAEFKQPDWGVQDVFKGVSVFALALCGDDPWTGIWGKIWPWQLPAEEGEHKLKKVLARTALRGVPIQALPTTPEATGSSKPDGREVTVVSLPPPRIELDGFGRQTITPLRDPVGMLPGPFGRRLRASKLRFRITIPVPALTTRIEIYRGDSLYYRETHQLGEFLLPGVHVWAWDGYDKDEIFDTMALKSGNLSARLTVTDLKGRTSVATMPIASGPDLVRWADVRIDPVNHQIDVTTFAQFLSPSQMELFDVSLRCDLLSSGLDSAMGWLAEQASPSGGAAMMGMVPSLLDAWPADAGTGFDDLLEEFRKVFRTEGQGSTDEESPAGDAISKYIGALPQLLNTGELEVGSELGRILSGGDLSQELFERYRTAVMSGIQRHWSRTVRIEAEEWTVTVNCKERAVDAQRTYLSSSDGPVAAMSDERSFNLSAIKEGLPIFNIWDDGAVRDQSEVDRGWITDVDARIARTGAHELGHSVLRERKDWIYSMLHKGTSSLGQATLPDSPFHIEEDEHGNVNWEIDLMFYYNDASSRPADSWQERERAAEEDACVLISMAKVSFG